MQDTPIIYKTRLGRCIISFAPPPSCGEQYRFQCNPFALKSQANYNKNMTLSDNILLFVGHCLPEIGRKFSYEKMSDAFEKVYTKKYSIKTLRKEFSCLKKQGLIKMGRRYRKPFPLLTRQGKIKITTHLSFKKYEHWDEKWRVVIFHIPEIDKKYRAELRSKLLNLGFRKIQNGVYISPHPLLQTINRVAEELAIRQNMILLESGNIEKEKLAAQKIWPLYEINQEYQNFIKKTHKTKRGDFWPLRAKILEQEFANIYQKDPHLPERLLSADWKGQRAYKIFMEIVRSY